MRLKRLIALAMLATSGPVFGDVIFTDGTFNLGDYTQTPSFLSASATSIVGSQCASCGDPGNALQIVATFGDTTTTTGVADLGFVNNTFSYDPSTQGAIQSITASVDKDLNISVTTTGTFGNDFRPLIEQDGNFYLAAIPGPGFKGGDTGFLSLSQSGLVAADFQLFDFSTETFLTGTPNFAGDPMLFGLGQISSMGGFTGGTITATYDNLSLDLQPVPEPSSLLLFAGLLPVLAAIRIARRPRAD